MNTVFDPLMLFISETDWQDDEKRDAFLEHLLDNLENISEYNITQVYWTDELENFLWNHPQLPPWRMDRDWKLKIVPVIYNLFDKCRILTDAFDETFVFSLRPPLKCVCSRIEIHDCFTKLVHSLIGQEERAYFCVGIANQLPDNQHYLFCCDCHAYRMEPVLINTPDDWLRYIDLENEYWPLSCSSDETERFRKSLNIVAKINFPKDVFIHEYEFTEEFIESVIQERRNRRRVLFSILKRLLMDQEKACRDGGLRDEAVRTKKNERRFRVTR
ncbi:MAG: hypothetical protein DRI57_28765, partial [Deltaproteobacteria bacterium]